MNMQRNHLSFRRNSEFRSNLLMFQYTKLHSCQDVYLPMPAGAPLGVSGRDRGPWKCTDLTGGTVRARSLRHYGTGSAESFRSFSAPKNWHMTAHGREAAQLQDRGDSQGYLRWQPKLCQIYPGRHLSHLGPDVPSLHSQNPLSLQRSWTEPKGLQ